MSDRPVDAIRRQKLSAMIDGELEPGEFLRTCDDWRNDAQVRADWHAYHLIGDVLRSQDLAHDGRSDAAFLAALRGRLATEPVVLAPERERPVAARRRRWAAPIAVAAGFCVVAGVTVVTRLAEPEGGAVVAVKDPPSSAGTVTVMSNVVAPPAVAVAPPQAHRVDADARLIRDAQLDRYLDAHRQYGNGSLLPPPGAVVRSASRMAP